MAIVRERIVIPGLIGSSLTLGVCHVAQSFCLEVLDRDFPFTEDESRRPKELNKDMDNNFILSITFSDIKT